MKTITRCQHILQLDAKDLELAFDPSEGSIKVEANDKRLVVGYLVQDSDCANPLEDCEGMGHIYSMSRKHINHKDADECVELLKDHRNVALSYFEHGNCIWGVAGTMSNMPDFSWDGVNFAGVWVPDKCAMDELKRRALPYSLGRVVKQGTVYVWMLDDGSQPNADTFKEWHEAFDALKAATEDRVKRPNTTGIHRAAAELAKGACEEYTSWCNGDCWGVCIDVFNPEGERVSDDACWGYVGSEWAEKERDARIKSELEE